MSYVLQSVAPLGVGLTQKHCPFRCIANHNASLIPRHGPKDDPFKAKQAADKACARSLTAHDAWTERFGNLPAPGQPTKLQLKPLLKEKGGLPCLDVIFRHQEVLTGRKAVPLVRQYTHQAAWCIHYCALNIDPLAMKGLVHLLQAYDSTSKMQRL